MNYKTPSYISVTPLFRQRLSKYAEGVLDEVMYKTDSLLSTLSPVEREGVENVLAESILLHVVNGHRNSLGLHREER